jgi:hypothetical protein
MQATASTLRDFYGWRIAGFAAITLAMTAPGQTVGCPSLSTR